MTFAVKVIQGGGTAAGTADFTDLVPLWALNEHGEHSSIFDTGMMANSSGGACQWQFVAHDDDGAIKYGGTPGGIEPHNVVLVTEDAPGYTAWLGRGRVSTVEIDEGDHPWGDYRRHVVTVDDANIDLKGLALTAPWSRPEETDVARVLAVGTAFLNGDPRATTVITAGTAHLVTTAVTRTMPAHVYPAGTDVIDIIEDCASTGGKNFQVVIHHKDSASHLCLMYLDEADLTTFASTLSITDTDPDLSTEFPPIFDQGQAVVIDGGENPVSEMVVTYGVGTASFHWETAGTAITDRYDYWSAAFGDSNAETASQANSRAEGFLQARSVPIRTHQISLKLPAAKVDLLSAGMAITIRSARAFGGENLGQTVTRRIAQLKWEPVAPEVGEVDGFYYAHMQLEAPRKLHLERFTQPGPQPPDQGAPGTCTRYYFSDTLGSAVSAPNPAADASWDTTIGDGTGANRHMLTTTKNSGDNNFIGGGLSTLGNNLIAQYLFALSGAGTISGKVRMQARARGDAQAIGAQLGQSQLVIRVVSSDGSTVRGTALAAYEPASLDSPNWPGSNNYTNRKFPASESWADTSGATLTSVTYQDGDYLVVEAGYRYINSSLGDEAKINFDNNGATDLPDDELTTVENNSWIEICTSATAGDTTQPIGAEGDADAGDDLDTYAPLDHVHEHGKLSIDATTYHSIGQLSNYIVHGDAAPTTGDDADDNYRNGTHWVDDSTGDVYILTDPTAGTAVWENLSGVQAKDFTASGDILVGSGSATYTARTNNFGGTAAPTANDDTGDGYEVGSWWYDTTNDKAYTALDVTSTAAVWKEITASPTGGTITVAEEDGAPSDDFDTIKFPNGSLTDNGDGSVSVTTGGGALAEDEYTRTAGNYTTTSTTFTDVDATNLSIAITTGTNRVLIGMVATAANSGNLSSTMFDLTVDGTRLGQANGLVRIVKQSGTVPAPANFVWMTDTLTAASHTIKLQWRVSAATTGTLYAGTDNPLRFWIKELPPA